MHFLKLTGQLGHQFLSSTVLLVSIRLTTARNLTLHGKYDRNHILGNDRVITEWQRSLIIHLINDRGTHWLWVVGDIGVVLVLLDCVI